MRPARPRAPSTPCTSPRASTRSSPRPPSTARSWRPACPARSYDGVVGVWYGKNPGPRPRDGRAAPRELRRHHPHGGALALVGDDPSCKSSTLPSAGEATLAALHMPTFFPGTLQEVLDLGLHAIALLARVGPVERAEGRHEHRRRAGTVAGLARPRRAGDAAASSGRAARTATRPTATCSRRRRWSSSARCSASAWRSRASTRALNQLNPISRPDAATPGSGIVAAGKVYYELLQALRDLGLDQRELERAGIRLMKVGMLYPHDRAGRSASSPRGLEEVLVVEEKLPVPRDARCKRRALRHAPTRRGSSASATSTARRCCPPSRDLDADAIALAVAAAARAAASSSTRRDARVAGDRGAPRRARSARRRRWRARRSSARAARTTPRRPTRTTRCSAPASAATRWCCSRPRARATITGITQMGGEGAQFVGHAAVHRRRPLRPEPRRRHVPPLRRRWRSASPSPPGANVTYKLLYNDTVAMTGGQDVLGQLKIPELTRWLELEGVKRIIVTTEEPEPLPRRARSTRSPRSAHRDELADGAGRAGRRSTGVTVLIHDQRVRRRAAPRCASAARRPTRRSASTSTSASARAAATAARSPTACRSCRSRPSSAARRRSTRPPATRTSPA